MVIRSTHHLDHPGATARRLAARGPFILASAMLVVAASLASIVIAVHSFFWPVSRREVLPAIVLAAVACAAIALELFAVIARSHFATELVIIFTIIGEAIVMGNLLGRFSALEENRVLAAVGAIIALIAAGHVRLWRRLR